MPSHPATNAHRTLGGMLGADPSIDDAFADPHLRGAAESILARPCPPWMIQNQPRLKTIADVGHDPSFIRRLAEREYISAFRERFRTIAPDAECANQLVVPPPARETFDRDDAKRLLDASAFAVRLHEINVDAARHEGVGEGASGGGADIGSVRAIADAPCVDGNEPRAIRLQLNRADYFEGVGSGDNLDVVLSMLRTLPSVHAAVGVQRSHVMPFLRVLGSTEVRREAPVTLMIVPDQRDPTDPTLALSQWAHDNAKPARTPDGRSALIVPRIATRGDCPSQEIPAERLVLEGFGASAPSADLQCELVQSDLLFQGGNILVVEQALAAKPGGGVGEGGGGTERVLVIGEAEIERNRHAFASTEEIRERFRTTFGVDRVLVLPNISFHIDYDVSFRADSGRVTAFVNDQQTACRIIAEIAIERLERSRASPADVLRALRQAVMKQDAQAVAAHLAVTFRPHITPDGRFAPSILTALWPTQSKHGDEKSPLPARVAFVYRILAAFDHLIAPVFVGSRPSENATPIETYFLAMTRQTREREALHKQLREQGWLVAQIPSTSDGACSLNALNALHMGQSAILPSFGRGLEPFDVATRNAWERGLSRFRGHSRDQIVQIGCDESQRRQGAVRCTVGPV